MKTLTRTVDRIETIARIRYKDGRIWEIRVHHHNNSPYCGPSVWYRLIKKGRSKCNK